MNSKIVGKVFLGVFILIRMGNARDNRRLGVLEIREGVAIRGSVFVVCDGWVAGIEHGGDVVDVVVFQEAIHESVFVGDVMWGRVTDTDQDLEAVLLGDRERVAEAGSQSGIPLFDVIRDALVGAEGAIFDGIIKFRQIAAREPSIMLVVRTTDAEVRRPCQLLIPAVPDGVVHIGPPAEGDLHVDVAPLFGVPRFQPVPAEFLFAATSGELFATATSPTLVFNSIVSAVIAASLFATHAAFHIALAIRALASATATVSLPATHPSAIITVVVIAALPVVLHVLALATATAVGGEAAADASSSLLFGAPDAWDGGKARTGGKQENKQQGKRR